MSYYVFRTETPLPTLRYFTADIRTKVRTLKAAILVVKGEARNCLLSFRTTIGHNLIRIVNEIDEAPTSPATTPTRIATQEPFPVRSKATVERMRTTRWKSD